MPDPHATKGVARQTKFPIIDKGNLSDSTNPHLQSNGYLGMKVLRGVKRGASENRAYVVPETGGEAKSFHWCRDNVGKTEEWECLYVEGQSQREGKCTVFRYMANRPNDAIIRGVRGELSRGSLSSVHHTAEPSYSNSAKILVKPPTFICLDTI